VDGSFVIFLMFFALGFIGVLTLVVYTWYQRSNAMEKAAKFHALISTGRTSLSGLTFKYGVLKIKGSRGGRSYNVRKEFKPYGVGREVLDIDAYCSLKPFRVFTARADSYIYVEVPAIIVQEPEEFKDVVILCFDPNYLVKSLTKEVVLTAGYDADGSPP